MKIGKIAFSIFLTISMVACSPKGDNASTVKENEVSAQEFAENQPLESGQYRAVNYDITGANPRKGRFDGRVMFSLSPEQSGIYVYENGNRAKIDYKLVLKTPFEKGDSGVYKATDVNDLPVVVAPDSIGYQLSFEKNKNVVRIGIDSVPMHTGSPLEMMERISAQIKKNSK